jgi:PPE-repeat protein
MKGNISICNRGFHFCLKLSDCFSYYSFDKKNIVCEVEAFGDCETHSDDSKACTNHIKIGRKLTWEEVLFHANNGIDNTGHSNSGYNNSGYNNSGYRNSGDNNSGDRNSGYRNSGDSNSGYRNSGDSNSGDRNSGNWNSGDRNSGDSNSGYRNSGAFCIDTNPKLILFDKESSLTVREWENSIAVQIMNNHLNTNIWIYANSMTDEEKEKYPKYETADGYLKAISQKEAWTNMWGNLSEENKKIFLNLENFDSSKFETITGIKI